MSCESLDYDRARNAAVLLLIVWPIGLPCLYIVLLWSSRQALWSGKSSSLSRAIGFLHIDYGMWDLLHIHVFSFALSP